MHKNGFSYKKPQGVPRKADAAKQPSFIKDYEALKASAGKDDLNLFMDAVHLTQATKLSCSWIRRGNDKPVFTTASRTRVNVVGCIQLGRLSET